MVESVWTIVILQLHGFPCTEDHRDSLAQYFSWWSMPQLCRFAGSR